MESDKYKIIYSNELLELESIINSYLDEGYIPTGGIMIIDNFRFKYYQAIYKV